ncbi:MAG TPA: MFS transporter [Phenylobacterium sp.]|uniref:MFS transporter n=1 Tax=Phenylobacterium sp. TaxID=1871053 RepID=UPI002B499D05|nr:MFS transporter [Phenylobacterium sp.]HKR88822.1 MFS transporter [Phenylobacterium sp.]
MSRIYYGWMVVAANVAIYTLIVGATYSSYGLFVLPISHELGLSRAAANSGAILMNLGMAAQAPFVGMLLDRVPAKGMMIFGSLLFAAAFALLALSHSLWLNAAVLAVLLPFAFQATGSLTAPLLIVRWFTVQRGRAMAISQLGLALGGVVLPPIVGGLIEQGGWRHALQVMGWVGAALLLAIAVAIRERPGPGDRERGAGELTPPQQQPTATQAPTRLKVGQILGSPEFWTINFSCGLVVAMATALLITLAPLARASGFSMIQSASLVSIMSTFAIISMLLLAVVADRIDRIVVLSILFALGAAVSLELMISHGYALLAVAAAAMGLIQGATAPMQYALLADRFGAASFGAVTGLASPLIAGLGLLTIRFSGEVFDRTGGYDVLFASFAALQLVAAGTILLTRFARSKSKADGMIRAASR